MKVSSLEKLKKIIKEHGTDIENDVVRRFAVATRGANTQLEMESNFAMIEIEAEYIQKVIYRIMKEKPEMQDEVMKIITKYQE